MHEKAHDVDHRVRRGEFCRATGGEVGEERLDGCPNVRRLPLDEVEGSVHVVSIHQLQCARSDLGYFTTQVRK